MARSFREASATCRLHRHGPQRLGGCRWPVRGQRFAQGGPSHRAHTRDNGITPRLQTLAYEARRSRGPTKTGMAWPPTSRAVTLPNSRWESPRPRAPTTINSALMVLACSTSA